MEPDEVLAGVTPDEVRVLAMALSAHFGAVAHVRGGGAVVEVCGRQFRTEFLLRRGPRRAVAYVRRKLAEPQRWGRPVPRQDKGGHRRKKAARRSGLRRGRA